MAHCLSPMGLWNKQKNQGMEDVQEIVRLDPSVMILSDLGFVEIIDMADDLITCMKRSKMMHCTFSIFYVTYTFLKITFVHVFTRVGIGF